MTVLEVKLCSILLLTNAAAAAAITIAATAADYSSTSLAICISSI